MKNPTDRIATHNLREIIISSISWNVVNAPRQLLNIQVARTEPQGIFERYPLKQLLNCGAICTKQNRESKSAGQEMQHARLS
jgi:hypothetical protein